jgi:hypothetical protein
MYLNPEGFIEQHGLVVLDPDRTGRTCSFGTRAAMPGYAVMTQFSHDLITGSFLNLQRLGDGTKSKKNSMTSMHSISSRITPLHRTGANLIEVTNVTNAPNSTIGSETKPSIPSPHSYRKEKGEFEAAVRN